MATAQKDLHPCIQHQRCGHTVQSEVALATYCAMSLNELITFPGKNIIAHSMCTWEKPRETAPG